MKRGILAFPELDAMQDVMSFRRWKGEAGGVI